MAQLPVRGFVRLEGERWRSMEDLSPMSLERVRQASRGADLLILKGDPGSVAQGSAARGIWYWPSGERGAAPIPGDWYLSAPDVSPVAGAFLGMPVDSFPPATQLVPAATRACGLGGAHGAARPARRGAPGGDRQAGGSSSSGDGRGRRPLALGLPRRLQRAELSHLGGHHGQLATHRRLTRCGVSPPRSDPWCRTDDHWCSSGPAQGHRSRRRWSGRERAPARLAPTRCGSTAPAVPL